MDVDKKNIDKKYYAEPDKDVEICQSYDTIPILKFVFLVATDLLVLPDVLIKFAIIQH